MCGSGVERLGDHYCCSPEGLIGGGIQKDLIEYFPGEKQGKVRTQKVRLDSNNQKGVTDLNGLGYYSYASTARGKNVHR